MSTGKVTIGETISRYSKGLVKVIPSNIPKKKVKAKRIFKKNNLVIDLRPKEIKKEKQYAFKEEEIGTKNALFTNNRRGE